MRIGPDALLTIEVSVADVTKREQSENLDEFTQSGKMLEDVIQSHCKCDLQSITNDTVEKNTAQMAEFSIK